MAWTEITRPKYRRDGLRYASDLTDGEWGLVEPLMPGPSRNGRPRETDLRKVVDSILYIASTGCQPGCPSPISAPSRTACKSLILQP